VEAQKSIEGGAGTGKARATVLSFLAKREREKRCKAKKLLDFFHGDGSSSPSV
jgi:hypothetical protein